VLPELQDPGEVFVLCNHFYEYKFGSEFSDKNFNQIKNSRDCAIKSKALVHSCQT
jgi:hypothetical protein